jgi:hypothetical protein
MADERQQIEAIVREVLAAMQSSRHTPCAVADGGDGPNGDTAQGGRHTECACYGDGDLVLSGRVVTLSDVEGRLKGVRRLVVSPQAVVTPAVRDELLTKNIDLTVAAAEAEVAVGSIRLVMVTAGKRFNPAALISALKSEGANVEPHSADCLIAATDRLAGELAKANTLGVLLTSYRAAALCLANRHRGVRGVPRPECVDEIGANLLVLDPSDSGMFQLKQTIGEFYRGGVRPCPEVFRERLG